MPFNTYPHPIRASYDRPLILYNQSVISGGNSPFVTTSNNISSPSFEREVTSLARGRGGVVTDPSISPEAISLGGGIVPYVDFTDESFYRVIRRYQEFLKKILFADADLVYFYPNDWQPVLLIDDANNSSAFYDATNLTRDASFSPQMSVYSDSITIDTSGNKKFGYWVYSEGVDISEYYNNPQQIPTIVLIVYFDNPTSYLVDNPNYDITIESNDGSITISSSLLGSDSPIYNISGSKPVSGWNVLTIPLYRDGNPTFAENGTFDPTTAFTLFRVEFRYSGHYDSKDDQVAFNSIFICNPIEARSSTCAVTSPVSISTSLDEEFENISLQVVSTFNVELTNYRNLTNSLIRREVLNIKPAPEDYTVIPVRLQGSGQQYPVFNIIPPKDTALITLQNTSRDEKLKIENSSGLWGQDDVVNIDTLSSEVSVNGSPFLSSGSMPRFFDGLQDVAVFFDTFTTSSKSAGEQSDYEPTDIVEQHIPLGTENSTKEFNQEMEMLQKFTLSDKSRIVSFSLIFQFVEWRRYSTDDYDISTDTPAETKTHKRSFAWYGSDKEPYMWGNILIFPDDGSGNPDYSDTKYNVQIRDKWLDVVGDYFDSGVDYTMNVDFGRDSDVVLDSGDYHFGFRFWHYSGSDECWLFKVKRGSSSPSDRAILSKHDGDPSNSTSVSDVPNNLAMDLEYVPFGGPNQEGGSFIMLNTPSYL